MQFAEFLRPYPSVLWQLSRQLDVNIAVSQVAHDEEGWDYMALLHQKRRFADAGLDLQVIETGFPWLHKAKLGLPGRDEEIEHACQLIRNMGAVGIKFSCWNWMAVINWTRTSLSIPTRGGALVSGYDHSLMAGAPYTEAGEVSEETLWESIEYFMKAVVPVAEEAGVYLALHPDDPPISPVRGIGRILTSADNMERAINLVPSPNNGLTLCQGNFAAMGEDIPAEIRRFGKKIFFVHFRDIRGTRDNFMEVFHDDGITDMYETIRTYREIGFDGPVRVDHVPTMAGESNESPGYEIFGRLYAVGYLRGLVEAAEKEGKSRSSNGASPA